jgi:hypothetical protein
MAVSPGGFKRESGKLVIKPEGTGKRREGLLRTSAGSLATKVGGTIARVTNGWPVTATGQICVSAGSTVSRVRYGLPLDSAGRVVVSTNAGVRNKANFLRDSGNRLVTVEGS